MKTTTSRLTRAALAALLLAAFPLSAAAVSRISPHNTPAAITPTPTAMPADATPTPPAVTSLSAALQAQHLTTLKTRGDAEITRRLTNLSVALAKLQAATTLTTTDKATLTSQIQTEVTGLTALKTKFDADTTLTDARADAQGIILDYRVYALMLPKTRLVAATDRLTVVGTKLTTLATQLQTALTNAKSAGQNVTSIQATLTDMQTKTTAITTVTGGLVEKLLALQPSDYNADHTVLESYRTTLVTAQGDAQAARNDAATIISALH